MNSFPYDPPADPKSIGMDEDRLARVIARFKKQQTSGVFPGGQLVVRRGGKLVVNESIGIARGFRTEESCQPMQVEAQTPFPVLSVGKPLAAICIALLEEHALLDIEAPLTQIIPEFGKHGKHQITTLDILTHRSGILLPAFSKRHDLWGDREAVLNALVESFPVHPRGTLAYHPHEYGWMLNEIVLRVDGRNLADFFEDELGVPLQLPALRFGLAERNPESVAFSYWLGGDKVNVAGVNVAEDFEKQNSKSVLEARNPATSLVSDAASIAAFYEFLVNGGRTITGRQLLTEETIGKYTSLEFFGWDRSLNAPISIGRGFTVGSRIPSTFGWWKSHQCFGHAGGFSSLAFGDHLTGISAAIITNGNRSMKDFLQRSPPLAQQIRSTCNLRK